jgi:hypothetical protein
MLFHRNAFSSKHLLIETPLIRAKEFRNNVDHSHSLNDTGKIIPRQSERVSSERAFASIDDYAEQIEHADRDEYYDGIQEKHEYEPENTGRDLLGRVAVTRTEKSDTPKDDRQKRIARPFSHHDDVEYKRPREEDSGQTYERYARGVG